ncbi:TRF2-interacting telomeric protein/Rap1 C terminal domain-containing protein [Rhypophila decipiens]|uniref:DNA-binding protein RAP1 n=1 Tax=Rhypophila decipiens TaxID=261697 RepID=A0AAN6Y5T6_9PEZI|nr:TRF2-interacting telomeric protein/Rap1 C terminal domain-containing protein [Rhypophila decipiens]
MSAVIVNEGVPNYEGTLFNGLKFYLHPLIPSKKWYADKLKSNGGKVVLMEQHADILIADHFHPKKAPPNAVSFRYITDCIEEGKICDITSPKYQIHVPPSGRSGVPSTGAKGTRTPFTDTDDKILVRWVIDHEKMGESLKGNRIYDLLAENHPNHTSQSWRARWVKKFSDLNRSNLDKYLEGPDLPPPPAPRRTDPQSSTAAVSRPTPAVPRPPAVSRPQMGQNAAKKRNTFSAEDDKRLLEYVEQRVKAGMTARGNVIYKEFEGEHPNHTWQSWLARYKQLVGRGVSAESRQGTSARQPIDLTADERASRPFASTSLDHQAHAILREYQRLPQPSTRANSRDTHGPIELWGATKSPTAGVSVPGEQPPPSSLKVKTEPNEAIQVANQRVPDKDEKKFYARLKTFQTFGGGPGCETADITLGGEDKVMYLWNLWSAATKQHSDHSLRDWKEIATALEISWKDFPDVTEQLKTAFEKSLRRFEEALADYPGSESDEEESNENGNEAATSAQESRDASPLPVASSPPPVTGSKRTRNQMRESSEAEPAGGAPKRRRYNKDDEIPCSPELARTAPVDVFRGLSSPQQLPLLPKVTPRGSRVLDSIEHDLAEPTPPRQQKPEPRIPRLLPTVRESIRSDSSDNAFDPPDDVRPVPRRPSLKVTEPRRRTLPNSWTKPAQPGPSGGSRSPAMLPPAPPPQRQQPPSRAPPQRPRQRKSPASRQPSTSSTTPQQPNIDQFLSLGYDEDTIMEALEATTNDVVLARQLMESIRDGGGIPPKLAGVWTSRDDKALDLCHKDASGQLGSDIDKRREAMQGRERLIKKHGNVRCRARAKFLGKMPWC